VFKTYDGEPASTPQRSLRLRLAVADLLMAVIESSRELQERDSSSRVESVVGEIRANPAAPVSIDALVARLSMSPSHLINEFKRLTGLPPLAFRNSCRIALAKRELEKGERSMSAIAEMLGYSSAQNFATQFRIATARTPRDWRNGGLSRENGGK
jgi:AraC-like DNA-binding protein